MNRTSKLLPAAVLLAACSATTQVAQETEAVRDFIEAADLIEVDRIRIGRDSGHTYISDHFVIVDGLNEEYLAEFVRRCPELTRPDFTPEMVDERRDPGNLRARFDTIRGCRIDKLYELTPEQAEELRNLGDAPGDEVYMPPEEES
ncbi:MAG: DUF6491 family protein [Woeseiaceae bacterium]|nr:DUF6491 family protein [Woeseiaceae bacterium]